MGARAGIHDHGHRLARNEPAFLTLLASPRLPPIISAPLPLHPLTRQAATGRPQALDPEERNPTEDEACDADDSAHRACSVLALTAWSRDTRGGSGAGGDQGQDSIHCTLLG